MTWTVSLLAGAALFSATLTLAIAGFAFRKRPDRMALPLAILMGSATIWAFPHGMSMLNTDPTWVDIWYRLQYPGVALAPLAYFGFAVVYAGYREVLTKSALGLLSIVPAVSVVLVWTNPWHELMWSDPVVEVVLGAATFSPTYELGYWIHLWYLYGLTTAGLAVFGFAVARLGPLYRTQSTVMFLAGLIPFLTNVATNIVGPEIGGLDPTTAALAVSGLLFAAALFRFDLLEFRPVAREQLLARIDDGMVVVGPDGRVRDFNRTASDILGDLDYDIPIDRYFPRDVSADGGQYVVESNTGERIYRVYASPILDARDRQQGRVIYLRDVTRIERREQRLSVLHRILRHNIRNELTVLNGRLEAMSETGGPDLQDDIDLARSRLEKLEALTATAREVDQLLGDSDDELRTVSATAVAERSIRSIREEFPSATIRFGGGEPQTVRVHHERLLELAIEELIENGVVHTSDSTPEVRVWTETVDDEVAIRIADDGPGIPEEELDVLGTTSESQLRHGSGLGLWVAYWTASVSGGSLHFEEAEGGGMIASLRLPASSEAANGEPSARSVR